jgi:hypothetical protein
MSIIKILKSGSPIASIESRRAEVLSVNDHSDALCRTIKNKALSGPFVCRTRNGSERAQ